MRHDGSAPSRVTAGSAGCKRNPTGLEHKDLARSRVTAGSGGCKRIATALEQKDLARSRVTAGSGRNLLRMRHDGSKFQDFKAFSVI